MSRTSDVIVLGSLVTHLRDPILALEAIRRVCGGTFMAVEGFDPLLTAMHRRRPVIFFHGGWDQWTLPNAAALRRMIEVAGFDVVHESRAFAVPHGPRFLDHLRNEGLRSLIRQQGLKTVAAKAAGQSLLRLKAGRPGLAQGHRRPARDLSPKRADLRRC